jgi:hypothetical protein
MTYYFFTKRITEINELWIGPFSEHRCFDCSFSGSFFQIPFFRILEADIGIERDETTYRGLRKARLC